jgi:RHH-type proline utilization regulon transcriptional repressor/proline dehydrogenase/delta 1-pyrroline-5-carboxylate dehydrogenase
VEGDESGTLWSPGIVDGVRPEDWFARTECFGPVLGLVSARDLDEALRIQRGIPYGLTGGIWSLDPHDCAHWVDRVDVGNAYVNRVTTGAIVGRQPFGGWKRSVVGPGAKAGGPNYVLQMCRLRDDGRPALRADPTVGVRAVVDAITAGWGLRAEELAALEAAATSDAYWMAAAFATGHDPAGLFCEANVLRYRALPHVTIRAAGSGATSFGLARLVVAACGAGAGPGLAVSLHPAAAASGVPVGGLPGVEVVTETADQLVTRLRGSTGVRVRLLGNEPELHVLEPAVHVDARRPVLLGRVELLRYLREQTVSRTLHRYGNVVPAPDA